MKKSLQNAFEIENAGGVVKSSDWTTGSGRHISKRPIPEYCQEIEVADLDETYPVRDMTKSDCPIIGERPALDIPKAHKARIKRFLKSNSKTRKVIYIADVRGFNAAKKEAGVES